MEINLTLISSLPYVFLGGGLGASFRFLISSYFLTLTTRPWTATLFANLLGCLLIFIGLKLRVFESHSLNLFLKVGFLGGLTTFSTFSLEVVHSLKATNYKEALAIILLNIIFGIAIGIGVFRQEII